jgi:hypothetical protein
VSSPSHGMMISPSETRQYSILNFPTLMSPTGCCWIDGQRRSSLIAPDFTALVASNQTLKFLDRVFDGGLLLISSQGIVPAGTRTLRGVFEEPELGASTLQNYTLRDAQSCMLIFNPRHHLTKVPKNAQPALRRMKSLQFFSV